MPLPPPDGLPVVLGAFDGPLPPPFPLPPLPPLPLPPPPLPPPPLPPLIIGVFSMLTAPSVEIPPRFYFVSQGRILHVKGRHKAKGYSRLGIIQPTGTGNRRISLGLRRRNFGGDQAPHPKTNDTCPFPYRISPLYHNYSQFRREVGAPNQIQTATEAPGIPWAETAPRPNAPKPPASPVTPSPTRSWYWTIGQPIHWPIHRPIHPNDWK